MNTTFVRAWKRSLRKYWQLYLLLIPVIAYYVIFKYVPMVGAQIAFRNFKFSKGIWGSPWVGLKHFEKFFTSMYFSRTVGNTLALSAYSLACGWPLPILTALMLNCFRSQKIKNVIQTVLTLPHFISVVVLVGVLFQLFNARSGIYGIIVSKLTGS